MNKQVIAKRLVELRGKRSQKEVAEANNIGISTLSMYENGQRIPKDEIKISLARYYGKSVEEIFYSDIYK